MALLERIAPASLTAAQAATLTGYKTTGGYWRVAMRQLQGDGRVRFLPGNRLAASAAGDGMTSGDALALWGEVLPAPADRLIAALLGGPLALDALAEVVGYSPAGGYFRTALRALRDAGVVVDAHGTVQLANPLPGETP